MIRGIAAAEAMAADQMLTMANSLPLLIPLGGLADDIGDLGGVFGG